MSDVPLKIVICNRKVSGVREYLISIINEIRYTQMVTSHFILT
jgi:hypothetical protein